MKKQHRWLLLMTFPLLPLVTFLYFYKKSCDCLVLAHQITALEKHHLWLQEKEKRSVALQERLKNPMSRAPVWPEARTVRWVEVAKRERGAYREVEKKIEEPLQILSDDLKRVLCFVEGEEGDVSSNRFFTQFRLVKTVGQTGEMYQISFEMMERSL